MLWAYNPVEFARWGASQGGAGGAEMGVYDVNGDKLNDVVTALEGHGFGLAWHEQKRDASGKITFVRHTFMDSVLDKNAGDVWFTQPHATTFADMNQDGILDFLVGKRHHSHFQYQTRTTGACRCCTSTRSCEIRKPLEAPSSFLS